MALANGIAACVLSKFSSLPTKFKPVLRTNGVQEWTTLCGIVLERRDESLTCVALACIPRTYDAFNAPGELIISSPRTGMKCLPASKTSTAQGMMLHDQHAEILALRAFNRYLIQQCSDTVRTASIDNVLTWVEIDRGGYGSLFTLSQGIYIHMYCSEAPCGDASMELIMDAQVDATPWNRQSSNEPTTNPSLLLGRGDFSQLGVVRRKPARPDAPLTLSKSCSDKLALKQFTSLLNHSTDLLISSEHMYLKTLVLPLSQHVSVAVERAFGESGRLANVAGSPRLRYWPEPYRFRQFLVTTTDSEFEFSRRQETRNTLKPSSVSVIWTPDFDEILIKGIRQGYQSTDTRSMSALCRKSIWHAASLKAQMLGDQHIIDAFAAKTYAEFKLTHGKKSTRKLVKNDVIALGLQGWHRNVRDDAFTLDRVDTP